MTLAASFSAAGIGAMGTYVYDYNPWPILTSVRDDAEIHYDYCQILSLISVLYVVFSGPQASAKRHLALLFTSFVAGQQLGHWFNYFDELDPKIPLLAMSYTAVVFLYVSTLVT